MKRKYFLVLATVILMAVFVSGCGEADPNAEKYDNARALFDARNFSEAMPAFEELGDYKDSRDMAKESKYLYADELYAAKDFKAAVLLWHGLNGYKDSGSLFEKALGELKSRLIGEEKYGELLEFLRGIGVSADESSYEIAEILMGKGRYADAISYYPEDFMDSKSRLNEARFFYAREFISSRKYISAFEQLNLMTTYPGRNELIVSILPPYGEELASSGKIKEAAAVFDALASSNKEYRGKAYELLIQACAAEGYPERVMGYLTIEKIGLVDIPIANGTDEDTMNKYIAHFPTTSIWCDNVTVTAHNRGYAVNYFGDLYDLVEGDLVKYRTPLGTQIYKVETYNEIEATDWSVTYSNQDGRMTLITCVKNVPSRRYCVVAGLLGEESRYLPELSVDASVSPGAGEALPSD